LARAGKEDRPVFLSIGYSTCHWCHVMARESFEDPEMVPIMERQVVLQAIDSHWQEYLRAMDGLRQGVSLRAYGQRDPLVEYKREAYNMFDHLMGDIKTEIANTVFRSTISLDSFADFINSIPQQQEVHDEVSVLGGAAGGGRRAPQPANRLPGGIPPEATMNMHPGAVAQRSSRELPDIPLPAVAEPKVGRNDPCPCGSGKKYKKCCGR